MIFGTLAQASVRYEGQANIYWEGCWQGQERGINPSPSPSSICWSPLLETPLSLSDKWRHYIEGRERNREYCERETGPNLTQRLVAPLVLEVGTRIILWICSVSLSASGSKHSTQQSDSKYRGRKRIKNNNFCQSSEISNGQKADKKCSNCIFCKIIIETNFAYFTSINWTPGKWEWQCSISCETKLWILSSVSSFIIVMAA